MPEARPTSPGAELSLGPISGDVSADSAVLWARASAPGVVEFELAPADATLAPRGVDDSTDFIAIVRATGLRPGTAYRVRARVSDGPFAEARFVTAPAADEPRALRLAWGGDVAGQNVCRDREQGFPIFTAISAYAPDVFIGLGDMIYADNVCEARGRYGNAQVVGDFGPATDLAGYRAHWRYVRADAGLARLLASTPYLAIWDDHEVVNDFGPLHDTRAAPPYTEGVHLLPIGLRAFLEYNPTASDDDRTPGRLYRSLRWGKHLEIFILDTRSYRDSNLAPDAPPGPLDPTGEIRRSKSLLGREQLAWLERKLAASDATWKLVVSSVPLAIPTGFPAGRGRDGWAGVDDPSGFAAERDELLGFLRERGLRRTLWITTDVHFAQVFVHRPFAADPGFEVIEAVTGPLNAGVGAPRSVDPALHPDVRFVYAPPDPSKLAVWAEARRWFNFGAVEIGADGAMTLRVLDVDGRSLWSETFAPNP